MKIKTVCELTDLSDRAVRHYIQEGLIAPAYSENYLGRRTFEFTHADVRMLKDIAVLRKFGFSIPEIKQVQENPWDSWTIVKNLRERKSAMIQSEQAMLIALSVLEEGRAYTVAELAKLLSAPVKETSIPAEDEKRNWKYFIKMIIRGALIGIIALLPLFLVLHSVLDAVRFYHYPLIDIKGILISLLALFPIVLIIINVKDKSNRIPFSVIRVLIPLCCICSLYLHLLNNQWSRIIVASKTEDFANYRVFDTNCYAYQDKFFQEMFPLFDTPFSDEYTDNGVTFTVEEPTDYYYYYSENNGYVHDIMAEWRLNKRDFNIEIERVRRVFEKDEAKNPETNNRRYVTFQKGDYTCIVRYWIPSLHDTEFLEIDLEYLFDNEKYPTECYMFAYNEQTQTVRYIYYWDYWNTKNVPPHYLTLDW